jgi:hypothetical protein
LRELEVVSRGRRFWREGWMSWAPRFVVAILAVGERRVLCGLLRVSVLVGRYKESGCGKPIECCEY